MRLFLLILLGAAGGAATAGGVFSFFVMIGLVPRLLQKTKTAWAAPFYEALIALGGASAGLSLFHPSSIGIGVWADCVFGFFYGIFVGCLAIALTETLDVMPILCRRTRITRYVKWLILSLTLGKAAGSLIYFFVPGFLQFK